MNDLVSLLRTLEATKFYGSLEAKFEAGRVVIIRKTETYVPNGREKREGKGGQLVSPE